MRSVRHGVKSFGASVSAPELDLDFREQKLGFQLHAELINPDDGEVWEWRVN